VTPGATLQLQARAIDKSDNISTPATLTVTAGAAIGVTLPSSTIVNAGSTTTVLVKLTSKAGPSGVIVDLSTEDAGVATVMTTPVQFAHDEDEKLATIKGEAGGSTALIASVAGLERARMTVTVQGGIITGRVLDSDFNGVVGADVSVKVGGVMLTTTSG